MYADTLYIYDQKQLFACLPCSVAAAINYTHMIDTPIDPFKWLNTSYSSHGMSLSELIQQIGDIGVYDIHNIIHSDIDIVFDIVSFDIKNVSNLIKMHNGFIMYTTKNMLSNETDTDHCVFVYSCDTCMIYFQNSYGCGWGLNGRGKIPLERVNIFTTKIIVLSVSRIR